MTKILITLCLALGFCVSTLVAQDTSSQSSSQGNQSGSQASQSNQGSQGSQTSTSNSGQSQKMSGKVSSDRKSFNSNGKNYTVSNPDALKGSEGQDVTVLVGVDPDTNTIHIVQLVPQQ